MLLKQINLLWFAVFQNLKVLLMQSEDRLVISLRYYDVDNYGLSVCLEYRVGRLAVCFAALSVTGKDEWTKQKQYAKLTETRLQ